MFYLSWFLNFRATADLISDNQVCNIEFEHELVKIKATLVHIY